MRGFTMMSLLFILVVLAALGAALVSVSSRQQDGMAVDIENARAAQAARAGLEWAAWQVLRNPAPPAAAPACFGTTSLTPGGNLGSLVVTVSCSRSTGTDGATALVFYQVTATACNAPSSGSCPNTAAAPSAVYVERQLSSTLSR